MTDTAVESVVPTHSFEPHADWLVQPQAAWEERLRQISPITDHTSHLRFRWRSEVGQWELYDCVPAAKLESYRVEQLTRHWSTLPASQQAGRKHLCTEYQHFMYAVHRVDAQRFWVLQGDQGGTPVGYTQQEQRLLALQGLPVEPVPMGVLPACPFDERAVEAIQSRDRLLHAPVSDAQAEADYRVAFLKWIDEHTTPQADLLKYLTSHADADDFFDRLPKEQLRHLDGWRDEYQRTGVIIGPETGVGASRVSLRDLL